MPAVARLVVVKVGSARRSFNDLLSYEPLLLVGGTALAVHLLHHIYHKVPNEGKPRPLREGSGAQVRGQR